jgi:putative peptide zinc metalloprotease protein
MALPLMRDELALHPGPRLADGQPTWTLHDPVRNQFFRIDWQTFAILGHWHLDDAQSVCDAVAETTPLHPAPEDVQAVAEFLAVNELVQIRNPQAARLLAERQQRLRGSWAKQLLHNYLFFRIPLVQPDRLLDRIAPWLEPFFTRGFLRLTLLALVVGLAEIWRNWEQFSTTLVDRITWQGLAEYGVALAVVKVLHELGHALTAKRFGCRVPAMGIAFLVMWPVAYTDTNEVWKLPDSRKRLAVACAGIATELAIAVWATLAWALLPDGGPKTVAFVLASLSWVTTVAINASPFMRFDGYFIASDWLDMPNLHSRAFALARWDLRERLFGAGRQPPEHFSRSRHVGLLLFAWGTWLYRLSVFFGIALVVYHYFFKLAGIFLFGVEIVWFIARPLWLELKAWRELWPAVRRKPRARRTVVIGAIFLLLFVVPWPTRVNVSGHLRPLESFSVYAPGGAQVAELPWAEGARVKEGATLVKLASPDLQLRWQRAVARNEATRARAVAAGVGSASEQQNVQVLQQDEEAAAAELASVQADAAQYVPTAPYEGVIRDIEPEIRPGVWVRKQERLLTLVRPGPWIVEAYLDEDALRHVKQGDSARFFVEGEPVDAIPLTVTAIDKDATRVLPNGFLATASGGSVLARQQDNALVPERAVYGVTLQADEEPAALKGHSWRGHVVIRGSWEPPAFSLVRSAVTLIWREAGF